MIGGRIHHGAASLDRLGKFARVPARSRLERHVFKKMSETVAFRGFVSRSGGQPHADRSGSKMGHRIEGDTRAVLEDDHAPGRFPRGHDFALTTLSIRSCTKASDIGPTSKRSGRE